MEPIEIITSYKGRPQMLYKSKVYNKRERRSTKKQKVLNTIYWKCKSLTSLWISNQINTSVIIASNENHHPDCEPMSVIFFITIFNTNPPHSNILIKYT